MQKDQVFTTELLPFSGLNVPSVQLAVCSNITKQCEVRVKDLFGPTENLSRQNIITQVGLQPE